jgi:glycosyltransferase involved in cell wall biosynthesis
VIVVDHGSTDDTPDVVASYGDRVRYIRREKDHGPIFAWVDGLTSATGELVHFTFDDDWISPDFIEKAIPYMRDDCAFVFTAAHIHDAANGLIKNLYLDLFPTGNHPSGLAERMLLSNSYSTSPGCGLFRRRDLVSALYLGKLPLSKSGYHGAGPDLLAYLLPLLDYASFGFVNEPLAHFYAHSGSITTDALKERAKADALKSAYAEVKKFYIFQSFAKRVGLSELNLADLARTLDKVAGGEHFSRAIG